LRGVGVASVEPFVEVGLERIQQAAASAWDLEQLVDVVSAGDRWVPPSRRLSPPN
jgi:hypothetical protein